MRLQAASDHGADLPLEQRHAADRRSSASAGRAVSGRSRRPSPPAMMTAAAIALAAAARRRPPPSKSPHAARRGRSGRASSTTGIAATPREPSSRRARCLGADAGAADRLAGHRVGGRAVELPPARRRDECRRRTGAEQLAVMRRPRPRCAGGVSSMARIASRKVASGERIGSLIDTSRRGLRRLSVMPLRSSAASSGTRARTSAIFLPASPMP